MMRTKLFALLVFLSALGFGLEGRAEIHRTLLTFTDTSTATTMSVRHYTDQVLLDPEISYWKVSNVKAGAAKKTFSQKAQLYEIEGSGRRVYAFHLNKLEPNSRYGFTITSGKVARPWRIFKTLPKDKNVWRIASGGDVGISEDAKRMWSIAAKSKPDVVLLGGDLAYSNGRVEYAKRWDDFLAHYENAFTDASGLMTPLIAAIGNHETLGSYNAGDSRKAPFFFPLFSTPGGPSYFERRLGNVQLLVLDTSHIVSHNAQRPFIESALSDEARWRLALYHVPLYPAHRAFDGKFSALGRAAWRPLFEQSVDVAFENHDHVLKRTLPFGRTTYLGDGCFGRVPRSAQQQSYLVTSKAEVHVWILQIDSDSLKAHALSLKGEVLDRVELSHARP